MGLDWIGGILFTIGATLVLTGIVYTSYTPSSSPKVIACLCAGAAVIIAFGFWERFGNAKYPLCPNDVFASHKGREFAVPFCLTFIVVGFFYGSAILYPTMLGTFYIDVTTSTRDQILLSLPSSLPLVFGSITLTIFGRRIGHWKWMMTASTVSLCLWGSLLALITPHNKTLMMVFVCLAQFSYGWAAYISVTYTQLGVPQEMLGTSGGLAGTARYAGGSIAAACYSTALTNGWSQKSAQLVPAAAMKAGVPKAVIDKVIAGVAAPATLSQLPGVTAEMITAVTDAYKEAAAFGMRYVAFET